MICVLHEILLQNKFNSIVVKVGQALTELKLAQSVEQSAKDMLYTTEITKLLGVISSSLLINSLIFFKY